MTTFSGRVAATALLALLLAACGTATGGGADPHGPAAGAGPDRAHLVKADRGRAGGVGLALGRPVRGVLRVNGAGCYVVGHAVAVAPRGSLALGDGLGVHVPSLGDLRTGDRVEAVAGDPADARRLPTYDECLDAGTRGVVVLG